MGKGRAPCCAKVGLNRGSWTPEEDMRLIAYIQKYGHANWRALPKQAGLLRCGKSCRLRWINYLRPDLKRGNFTADEEETIIKLHAMLGNKWSKIASCLPGRTDNEIKNVWNTHLKKRVSPAGGGGGEDDRGAAGSKKKKKNKPAAAAGGGAEATHPLPSPSPSPSSSTTTTTNCSSGYSGEQQSNTSKEDDDELDLESLETVMPMLDDPTFGFDMLVDPVPPPPPPPYGQAVSSASASTSPCASSTSPPPPPGVEDDDLLLVLPEIDIDQELWSIIDGDGDGGCTAVAAEAPAAAPCCQISNASQPTGGANTTSHGAAEEGKEWWLEDLERELGLWAPVEDYQDPMGPHDLVADNLDDPLPAMVDDPVSCYFQAGPASSTMLQEPGYSYSAAAVAITSSSNQMEMGL